VHEGIIPKILKLADTIKQTALAHLTAWKPAQAPLTESWFPPSKGAFKINFDTTIRDQYSAQAAVCREHSGTIISACSQISTSCDFTYGEALAALLAASLATSLKLKNFIIEGDSKVVVAALQDPSIVHNWMIAGVIADSLHIIPASSSWEARKINRSANFCAHHLVYWAAARVHSGCIPIFFSFSPPPPTCSGIAPPSVSFPP
jgi:hypothetical protein